MGEYVWIFILCLIATPILNQVGGLSTIFENPDLRQGVAQLLIAAGLLVLLAKGLAVLAASRSGRDDNNDDRERPW